MFVVINSMMLICWYVSRFYNVGFRASSYESCSWGLSSNGEKPPRPHFRATQPTDQYNRETKLSLYAEARINDYWIVNLLDNRLEVYSKPFSDAQGKFDYRTKNIVLPDEKIAIPGFIDIDLELASIFPKN